MAVVPVVVIVVVQNMWGERSDVMDRAMEAGHFWVEVLMAPRERLIDVSLLGLCVFLSPWHSSRIRLLQTDSSFPCPDCRSTHLTSAEIRISGSSGRLLRVTIPRALTLCLSQSCRNDSKSCTAWRTAGMCKYMPIFQSRFPEFSFRTNCRCCSRQCCISPSVYGMCVNASD